MAKAGSIAEPMISPIRRDQSAVGFTISLMLHVAIVGAFYISWPYLKKDVVETPPVIVDLVPIDEITAAPPKPTPKIDEQPPQPTPEVQRAPEESAPKPDEMPPEPKPAPPPPPPPKPEAIQQPKVPPPPPKPQPPKKKDDMQQLAQLLKDLEKKQPPKPQTQNPAVATAQTNNQTPSVSDRATMTELDAIRSHIESCWRIDPGQEGIENLSADIRVFINPDGSVRDAVIVDSARDLTDRAFHTFAYNAKISVQACKGIPITPQHYDQLKDMVLTFSPQGHIN